MSELIQMERNGMSVVALVLQLAHRHKMPVILEAITIITSSGRFSAKMLQHQFGPKSLSYRKSNRLTLLDEMIHIMKGGISINTSVLEFLQDNISFFFLQLINIENDSEQI